MIAEIFMVRLETTARLRQEAVPTCSSHFVPFVSGSHFNFMDGEAHPAPQKEVEGPVNR